MTTRRWIFAVPTLLVVLLALTGPWLAPGGHTTPSTVPFSGTDGEHLLGTDFLGRDVLSRVLWGGQVLVLQAVTATALGSLAGLGLGTWAGLSRHHRAAQALLRAVDALAAVPALLLLLLVAAGITGSDTAVAFAVAAVSVPFSVRVNHERVVHLAATDYAREARARGESTISRIRYDILPGLAGVALAEAGIRFVAATQLAATAGFLGLGSAAPAANWGRMVRENSTGLMANPLPVLVPAALLVVLAVGATVCLDQVTGERSARPRIAGRPA
ncbi:ABC transporter permease subunit [Kineosporia sp. J2-2]|uniref:ABC transporter permease subunit n=1 Tax=Kineosporia corallincola TaxID=2835133 RepID=A0ABS5TT95_9ACTN|nr:ABC transporter permease subunit [Kineosporia corallincola]MBT0774008.1 ABC transporter permease subunit [Kineosporia corallincola]